MVEQLYKNRVSLGGNSHCRQPLSQPPKTAPVLKEHTIFQGL